MEACHYEDARRVCLLAGRLAARAGVGRDVGGGVAAGRA